MTQRIELFDWMVIVRVMVRVKTDEYINKVIMEILKLGIEY